MLTCGGGARCSSDFQFLFRILVVNFHPDPLMNLTRTAYGTWSGGKFMHFGEMLDDERYVSMIRRAFDKGVRTFVTADVYGAGRADSMLGQALQGLPLIWLRGALARREGVELEPSDARFVNYRIATNSAISHMRRGKIVRWLPMLGELTRIDLKFNPGRTEVDRIRYNQATSSALVIAVRRSASPSTAAP